MCSEISIENIFRSGENLPQILEQCGHIKFVHKHIEISHHEAQSTAALSIGCPAFLDYVVVVYFIGVYSKYLPGLLCLREV